MGSAASVLSAGCFPEQQPKLLSFQEVVPKEHQKQIEKQENEQLNLYVQNMKNTEKNENTNNNLVETKKLEKQNSQELIVKKAVEVALLSTNLSQGEIQKVLDNVEDLVAKNEVPEELEKEPVYPELFSRINDDFYDAEFISSTDIHQIIESLEESLPNNIYNIIQQLSDHQGFINIKQFKQTIQK